MTKQSTSPEAIKQKVWSIVFEAETRAGKIFDIALLWLIVASVLVVMLETVDGVATQYGLFLGVLEWVFTILFTIEYGLRLWLSKKVQKFSARRLDIPQSHGSGCTLSAAITANLAKGQVLSTAVNNAKSWLHTALRNSLHWKLDDTDTFCINHAEI